MEPDAAGRYSRHRHLRRAQTDLTVHIGASTGRRRHSGAKSFAAGGIGVAHSAERPASGAIALPRRFASFGPRPGSSGADLGGCLDRLGGYLRAFAPVRPG